MKKAVVLHTIDQAEHCLKEGMHQDSYLFSTHSSVNVYLKERHHLESRCLSAFLNEKEILSDINTASSRVEALLGNLDERLAPAINKQYDLKMRYFVPLYSYSGKNQ